MESGTTVGWVGAIIAASRSIRKAGRLRKRLGGSECTEDPFQQAKGMHHRTYERLRAEGERLDEIADHKVWSRFKAFL